MLRKNPAHGREVARVWPYLEVLARQFRGHGCRKFPEWLPVLDENVQVFGGIRVQRRRQDAAIAERSRAELHAALHPRQDFLFPQKPHRARQELMGGAQILEAQLAVLQHFLDFGGIIAGAEQQRCAIRPAWIASHLMPDVKHGAQRGPRISRRRLYKDVLPLAAVLDVLDKQGVEKQAARQAKVLALARHRQDCLLHGLLETARDRSCIGFADSLVELGAEPSSRMTAGVEKGRIEPRRARKDLPEERRQTFVARGGKPLDFMFVGAGAEAKELRDGAIEPPERIRVVPLLLHVDFIAAGPPQRAASKVAGVVESEHRRLFKRRGEESRRRVGLMMLHHHHFRVWKLMPQGEMKDRFRPARERARYGHALHFVV